jgi:DNA mismatch repair protein MutL
VARIYQLSPLLANQIAAGEVVERPASVVKELLENAVDAGATHVRVDVEDGGVRLIRIRDDGHGMDQEDLVLAFERHATSKLRHLDDLGAVATLGFRGEALPSIASVARVHMTSRTTHAAQAWCVDVEGVAFTGEARPAAGPKGTVVEVRDLFFNTPARRRFLRTARTEYLQIEETVRRVALANSDVEMDLWRDGKRQLHARRNDDAGATGRLAGLCGKQFVDSATAFDETSVGMRCYGWVTLFGAERAHADLQHTAVNGRVVRDPLLRHALRTALAPGIDEGRHPGYVVFLELPAAEVDVNVHPTKHEVRFRDARTVRDFISSVVGRAAADAPGVDADGVVLRGERSSPGAQPDKQAPAGGRGGSGGPSQMSPRSAGATLSGTTQSTVYARLAGPRVPSQEADNSVPPGRTLIRLAARFCARQDAQESWSLIDLAAAAEKVVESDLERRLNGESRPATPLLLPCPATLDETIADALEAQFEVLEPLGFSLRRTAATECVLLELASSVDFTDSYALIAALAAWASAPGGGVKTLVSELAQLAGDSVAHVDDVRVAQWFVEFETILNGVAKPLTDTNLRRVFDTSGG